MTFDCIIMNPPYQRNLHTKILAEIIKHLAPTGKIVSLQPVDRWQKALLFGSEKPVAGTIVLERFSMSEASKIFGIEQRCDLGIVSTTGDECVLVENLLTLSKLKVKLQEVIKKVGTLEDKLEKDYKDFPVNFGYGCTIAGHGGHGKACYRLTNVSECRSTRREKIGHCMRYNAENADEQHKIWMFYSNQLIRFIAKEFGFGGIPYEILPFASGFVDESGKTPLDEVWSFEKLAKWFGLDRNDLKIVRKSLDTYLYPEEQKIIEETIKKYK